ncbi:uncharacterized protein LOC135479715 [Liolophura sinensis]|uniref:uncharacterized protein LOC135479715 n=1 Tax=Liolophura sinensis TaxID=3198878 RepID=UPI003158992C
MGRLSIRFSAWAVYTFTLLACYPFLTSCAHAENMSEPESFNFTSATGVTVTSVSSPKDHLLTPLMTTAAGIGAFYNNNVSSVDSKPAAVTGRYINNTTTTPVGVTIEDMVFTATETISLDIPLSKPVVFDVYQKIPTKMHFRISESHSDLQMTLNTSGTVEEIVNNVRLSYTIQEEENDTVVQVTIIQSVEAAVPPNPWKVWQIVVPVVLCGLCGLVLALCLVKCVRQRRARCQMRPSHPTLDATPGSRNSETVITKRYIGAPSYLGSLESAPPEEIYDRSAYIIRARPANPYTMDGHLDRISEERASEIMI